MKHLLKRLARRAGLVVTTAGHSGARYLEDPPQSVLDEVLLHVFPSLHGLNFVQVGANDGVRFDPIRRHVLRHGWSGLLIEPVASHFQLLERNYAGAPRLAFLNAAIDTQSGTRQIFQLRAGLVGLPDWTRGLASFNEDHVRTAVRDFALPADAVAAEAVATVTWDEVRARFGPRACDILIVDAEGYDVALLRRAGLARWRPRVVQFEHACVDRTERLAFYSELLEIGYEISTAGADTVAWLTGNTGKSAEVVRPN